MKSKSRNFEMKDDILTQAEVILSKNEEKIKRIRIRDWLFFWFADIEFYEEKEK